MQRPLRRSRSFKVTDFGTNRKLMYDYLLVSYTVFKLWLIIGQIFASERRVPYIDALARVIPPANIAIKYTSIKTGFFGLHFRCRKHWCIFNHFYVICP